MAATNATPHWLSVIELLEHCIIAMLIPHIAALVDICSFVSAPFAAFRHLWTSLNADPEYTIHVDLSACASLFRSDAAPSLNRVSIKSGLPIQFAKLVVHSILGLPH